jgi:cytoskeleton protein RodZ
MATIGQQLKHARTERTLTVEDVAFHTRIPAARVRDMENDDLSRFANLTYARGFLKIYGEYLDLNLSEYLGQFQTEEFAHASGHEYVQTANATHNLPAAVFTDDGRTRRPGLYLLVAAVAMAGGIVWWSNRGHGDPELSAPSQVTAASPSVEASHTPASAPPASARSASGQSHAADEAGPLPPPPPAQEVASAPPSTTEIPQAPVEASAPAAPAHPPVSKGPPPKAKVIEEREP